MRAIRSLAAGLLLLTGQAAGAGPAPEPGTWRTLLGETRTARESHLFLTGLMESAGVPTLSVAVVQDGRIVFDRMLGTVDPKGGRPAGSDTVLRAASLSKPVFSYLVMRLVDEGVLGLDAPLTALVQPPFTTWPAYASLAGDPRHTRLTPAILLSHASGFVNWRRPRDTGTLSIGFEPGSQFSYSGEGYYLLQAALEKKTGLGLGELARTKVFEPLGMANSSFLWEPRFDGRLAVDMASDLGPLIRRTRTSPNAAGSLLTNAVDYAALVVAAMEGRGLTPATAQAWKTPRLRVTGRALHDLTPPAASANDAIQLSWTPGWGWFRSPAGPALFHLGMEEGCESYVVFFPERRTGIVIQSVSDLRTRVSPAIVKQLIGDAWSPFAWMRY